MKNKMIKVKNKYCFSGKLEDLVKAFPDLKYSYRKLEDPGAPWRDYGEYIIDASQFDAAKMGRFCDASNNYSIHVKDVPLESLVPAVLKMFRRDGDITVVQTNPRNGENYIDAYALKEERSTITDKDPWNCDLIVARKKELPDWAAKWILATEAELVAHLKNEPSCQIYVNSSEYRLKVSFYGKGYVVYRQFGFNEKNRDTIHETPQDLCVISPPINEIPIAYKHIQYLRPFGEVEAGSTDSTLYARGEKFKGVRLRFSKIENRGETK